MSYTREQHLYYSAVFQNVKHYFIRIAKISKKYWCSG